MHRSTGGADVRAIHEGRLAALGLGGRRDAVRRALADARRRAGLSRAETGSLAGLGIDVLDVAARVEETHGVGAMSGDRRVLLALTLGPGVPAEVLADHGVTHESLTRVLGEGTGEAACV
ncbi:hypothetical protein ABZX60_33325 [Streptomyces olivaceus]